MSKLTSKSAAPSVAPANVIPVTIDPGAVPLSRKLTLSNLVKSVVNLSAATGADPADIITVAQAVGEGRKLTWSEAMAIASRNVGIQIGTSFEDGGASNGTWRPIGVFAGGTSGTVTARNAGDIAGDPCCTRLDNGAKYSVALLPVHLVPVVVKWRVKLGGGTAGMDMQLAVSNVVPSGLDAAVPSQEFARFRLFVQTSSDAFWQAQMNQVGGPGQIAATSLAAADTDWHWFEIRFNAAATTARFYIDGVLEATLSTAAAYPAARIGPMIYNRRFSGSGQYLYHARCWVVNGIVAASPVFCADGTFLDTTTMTHYGCGDYFTSYLVGSSVDGLSGGVAFDDCDYGWDGPWIETSSFAPFWMGFDSFGSYTPGADVDALAGGSYWDAAWFAANSYVPHPMGSDSFASYTLGVSVDTLAGGADWDDDWFI